MRSPTAKEAHVLKTCLDGLALDIECLTTQEPGRNVHGTTRVNLEVMLRILSKLESESDPSSFSRP